MGTLPESVVNRRVRLARPSCECVGGGSRVPFRGGDTKPSKAESFRAVCWLRKRSSSIRSLALFEYAMIDCYSTEYLSDMTSQHTERKKAKRWGLQCAFALRGKVLTECLWVRGNYVQAIMIIQPLRPGEPGAVANVCVQSKERRC